MHITQIVFPIMTLAVGVAIGLTVARKTEKRRFDAGLGALGRMEQAPPAEKRYDNPIVTPAEQERPSVFDPVAHLAYVSGAGAKILQSKKQEIRRALRDGDPEMNCRKQIAVHLPSGEYEIDEDSVTLIARLREKHPKGAVYKQLIAPLLLD